MNKQQFDDAIGAAPPSTVDVDAIVARQRRAAQVRRVAAPGVATAGVVAVTFGIAIALPSGSGGGGGGAVPASQPEATRSTGTSQRPPTAQPYPPTTTSQPPPVPPLPCAQGAEQVPAAAARLSSALTAAVRRQIPDAELTANPTVNFGGGHQFGPLEFFLVGTKSEYDFNGDCMDPDGTFMAKANVSDAAGIGNIGAFVGTAASNGDPQCGNPESTPGLVSCAPGSGPNGETYVAYAVTDHEGSTYHRVDFVKPDGTGGSVIAQNVAGDIKLGKPAQRPQPPLTVKQLIAIALDPGLTLYPPS